MKLFHKIFAAVAGMMALSSCVESAIDPLDGSIPAPTVVTMTEVTNSEASKDENGRRLFVLDLTDGTNTLHATFVGNKYYLTKNTYTKATDAAAKNGNFIIDGKTTVNNKKVIDGTIALTVAESTYGMNALLFLEDGTAYKIAWTGELIYENDEPETPGNTIGAYYVEKVEQSMNWRDNQNPVAIEGMETHTLTLTNEAGETIGGFELVLAAGTTSLAGEWTCQSYPDKDHLMGNGYAIDMGEWGFYVGGSYLKDGDDYITVNEGDKFTVTDLGNGVYKFDGTFTITIAPVGYVPGAPEVLTMTEKVEQTIDGMTYQPVAGVETHTITLTKGEEVVAVFSLLKEEGTTEIAGEYSCEEYASAPGLMGNGFDGSLWGIGIIGSYYYENGELILIQPGTSLTVTKNADGSYTFDGGDYKFTGKAAAETPENPEPENPEPENPEPEVPTVTLTGLYISDYVQQGATNSSWQTVEGVETHYITLTDGIGNTVGSMQLVLTSGTKDIVGIYLVKEYATECHHAGNGYDLSAMGMGIGGSYYYNGEELVLINPGETITVTKNTDGSYTFSGKGFSLTGSLPFTATDLKLTEKVEGCVDATWQPVAGVASHVITLTDATDTVVGNMQLVLTEGATDITGTYTVKEYAAEDHFAGNGYDMGDWGKGGCYYVNNGTVVLIFPGATVTVTNNEDGSYTFSGIGFSLTGTF